MNVRKIEKTFLVYQYSQAGKMVGLLYCNCLFSTYIESKPGSFVYTAVFSTGKSGFNFRLGC